MRRFVAAALALTVGFVVSPPTQPSPGAPPLRPGFFQGPQGSARARLAGFEATVQPDGTLALGVAGSAVRLHAQLESPAEALEVSASGELASLRRGAATEEWSTRGGALTQQWRFASAPAGAGDLEVRLSVTGATVSAAADEGVRLQAPAGSMRLSHAVWVDATGARTAVPAQAERTAVAYRVPRAVLATTSWPAVLDPTFTAEQPLSNDTQAVSASGRQTLPAVATIGNTALVVWVDDRRGSTVGPAGDTDVFGALVDVTGGQATVLRRFPIALGPGLQANPAVAAGANEFLVTWEDTPAGQGNTDVFGALIPTAGPTGRPRPFAVRATAQNEVTPAVAYSSSESKYLVVFDANAGLGPIQAVRVDPATGGVSGAVFNASGASANSQITPRVASTGSNWVVVWADVPSTGNTNVFYSQLPAGSTTQPTSTQVAATTVSFKTTPDVIAGPNEHLIIWADNRAGVFGVYGAVVNASGTLVQPQGVQLRGGGISIQNPHGSYMPAGAKAYSLTWFDDVTSLTAHVANLWVSPTSLAVFPTTGIIALPPSSNGGNGVAVNQNFYGLISYSDGFDLNLVPISTIGNPDPTRLKQVMALPSQEQPRVTSSAAGEVLVTWSGWNGVDGGYDLAFRRYHFDGGAIDPAPQPLLLGALSPTIVQTSGGLAEHLALYQATGTGGVQPDVFGIRVGSNGTVGTPFAVTATTGFESAAGGVFDGTNHQALFFVHQLSGGRLPITLAARRVAPDGTLVDAAPYAVLGPGPTLRNTAAAANDAGTVLVAVQQDSLGANLLWSALLSGAVSDGGRLVTTDAGFPTVASTGSDFLLAWESYPGSGTDLYGQRISANGTLLDPTPVPLEVGPSNPQRPNLTFNGRQYLLSWHERGSDGGYDVKGRWLSPALQPLNELLMARPVDDALPRAVSDGLGHSFLAFVRLADDDDPSVPRIFTTSVTAGLLADVCTSAAQCFGGSCVGGVCCDRPCTGSCETCLQAEGATADGTCGPRSAGTTCRVADAGCDAVEVCDGTSPSCPPDVAAPATTVCRPDAGDCDQVEHCDGLTKVCPADALVPMGTQCQSTTLLCGLPASCTGTSPSCPSAGVRAADFVCRAKRGDCDFEEKCDGLSPTCPDDTFAASSSVCRQAAGQCDLAEQCPGNGPDCPPDQKAPTTQLCRGAIGVCDTAEFCDGASATCPANAFAGAELICAPAADGDECDDADVCPGDTGTCGADRKKADGTACQNGGGTCQAGHCTPLEHSRYGWSCLGCSSGAGLWPLLAIAVLARRRRRAPLARLTPVAALALMATLVLPQVAHAEPKRLKLIFSGVAPGAGVSAETASSVAEYLQSELSAIDAYDVVSHSDLQAMLGIDRQKQLLGCSDTSTSCFSELAGALDADRLLRAELARLDETIVLTVSLVDLRKGAPMARVSRNVESGGISAALREIRPLLYELLNQAPEQGAAPLTYDRGFGGISVGLRGDADVLARGVAPGIFAELSGRYLGGALTVIPKDTPGVRLEVKVYPITFKRVRPYFAAGSTIFTTGLSIRGAAGAAVRIDHLQIFADAAYERFVADFRPGYSANAVILGLGLGWQF